MTYEAVTPLAGLTGAQTRAVLAAAASAPSLYDTRPWRLVTSTAGIGLSLDRDRLLPVIDPDAQQALLACGAALLNLRLVIRTYDRHTDVRLLPDPRQPDLLALVRTQGHHPAIPGERRLAAALAASTETSTPLSSTTEPIALRGTLHRAATAEQAWLVSVNGHQRVGLAGLLAQAHARQIANPAFRTEWFHYAPHDDTTRGADDSIGGPAPPTLDTTGTGLSLVAVIGSVHDTTRARLQAGQAAQRMTLTAIAEGLTTTSLAPVIQVPPTRAHLRSLLGGGLWPQAALHLDVAPDVHAYLPRRATPAGG